MSNTDRLILAVAFVGSWTLMILLILGLSGCL